MSEISMWFVAEASVFQRKTQYYHPDTSYNLRYGSNLLTFAKLHPASAIAASVFGCILPVKIICKKNQTFSRH